VTLYAAVECETDLELGHVRSTVVELMQRHKTCRIRIGDRRLQFRWGRGVPGMCRLASLGGEGPRAQAVRVDAAPSGEASRDGGGNGWWCH